MEVFFVNVKSRELMASSILYPCKTPGGGEKRGEISQAEGGRGGERDELEGERERKREGQISQREKVGKGEEEERR